MRVFKSSAVVGRHKPSGLLPPRPVQRCLGTPLQPVKRCPGMICRITNTSEEIYKQLKLKEILNDEIIEVHDTQVLYPELGSLESRVSAFYLDELMANSGPDLEETAYWFHTPKEGWKQEPTRYKCAPEVPVTFANPIHQEWQEEGRTRFEELQEGQVLQGMITDIWLYHGCQIDLGFEYDGLVCMTEDEWMEPGVRDALMPGDNVVVKVHKLREPGLYRWPVQLELVEPAHIAGLVMDPDEYEAPINHDWATNQGMGMKEILAATGRVYEPTSYLLPQDDAQYANDVQQAFGFDVENENVEDVINPMEERIAFQYAQDISDLASKEFLQAEDS